MIPEAWALRMLRFDKGCELVCTELTLGANRADVFGIRGDTAYEVEVKRSREDFKRDFTCKAEAHEERAAGASAANYHYFLVPDSIADLAAETCRKVNPRYGVVAYADGCYDVRSVRRALSLHGNPVTEGLRQTVQLRMSSELVNFWIAHTLLCDAVAATKLYLEEAGVGNKRFSEVPEVPKEET